MGAAGSFPIRKSAVAWNSPLDHHSVPRLRMSGVIPPLSVVPFSRRRGHLHHPLCAFGNLRDNLSCYVIGAEVKNAWSYTSTPVVPFSRGRGHLHHPSCVCGNLRDNLSCYVTGAEVKNEWSYSSTPRCTFFAWTWTLAPSFMCLW